ncbi:hypothetical protein [Sphingomonas metalli]|uniref:hypothetical protein n=1 Tax=Sphingomonas metalli TaxID=1779358 RepID=UPI0027E42F39|nr:hypothetical protein [Sphingomonas metalli]
MAGNYKVTSDFRETAPWHADYTPIAAKVSGGHKSVRVIENSGRRIVLQHLLVVKTDEGKSEPRCAPPEATSPRYTEPVTTIAWTNARCLIYSHRRWLPGQPSGVLRYRPVCRVRSHGLSRAQIAFLSHLLVKLTLA